ncbi:PhzF family phenazine biosynthesis protein [Streptomyces sp. NBC_00448]|uniref:PhzF family phenazine biosynthesis protein n=1 Tax=Streptomyces sp. NBC_00448 TaxID=2903652 RepID=UPI002E20AE73
MPATRTSVDVLTVLCGPDRRHGSEVAVVRDGRPYPDHRSRRELAARLGCPHTVFVDDPERGAVEVHRPGRPAAPGAEPGSVPGCELAPHALIGAAWLLDLEILEIPSLGDVFARHDGEFGWVTALAGWAAPCALRQYAAPALVEALPAGDAEERHYAWAWSDEAAGRVVGAEHHGTASPRPGPTGAGALLLAHHLQRALNVSEAPGAQILCAPGADGTIEIGGRVLLDPARHLRLG